MNRLASIIYHGSRLILAGVFIYAGAIKGTDPVAFAGQVANYQILPYAWNYLVAAILPYLELLCGILLLLNKRIRPAVLVLFVLNLIFKLLDIIDQPSQIRFKPIFQLRVHLNCTCEVIYVLYLFN